jgi:hypothetical protein
MKKRTPFKVEWEAHQYEYKERSQDWFWAVGIVAVSIAVASIIFGNFIFGLLVIVSAFALTLFINREPETVHITLNEFGVTKGKVHYPYESLHSFWIELDHSHQKIMLRSEKFFMPLIIIPLDDRVDVENVHEILSHFIQEEHHAPPLVERLLEYLGF